MRTSSNSTPADISARYSVEPAESGESGEEGRIREREIENAREVDVLTAVVCGRREVDV